MAYVSGIGGTVTIGSFTFDAAGWSATDTAEAKGYSSSAAAGWTARGAGVKDTTISVNGYLDATALDTTTLDIGAAAVFTGVSSTGITGKTGNFAIDEITIDVDWGSEDPVSISISGGCTDGAGLVDVT